jgi:hypothetical protein
MGRQATRLMARRDGPFTRLHGPPKRSTSSRLRSPRRAAAAPAAEASGPAPVPRSFPLAASTSGRPRLIAVAGFPKVSCAVDVVHSRRTSASVRPRRPRDVSRRSRRLGSSVEQARLTRRARSRPGWLLGPVSDRPSACYRVRGAGPTGVGAAAPRPKAWFVGPAAPASTPPLGDPSAYVFWLLPTAARSVRSAPPPRRSCGPSRPAGDQLPATRTVVLL